MSRSIKDLYGDLPSGLFANDEDDALVKEDNGRYVYKDLSKEVSLSYSLSGDNAIKVHKSTLSKHNSSTTFLNPFMSFQIYKIALLYFHIIMTPHHKQF